MGIPRSVTGFGILLTGREPYRTSTFVTIPEVELVFFGLEKWTTASFVSDFASSTCDMDQRWKTLVTLGIMSF